MPVGSGTEKEGIMKLRMLALVALLIGCGGSPDTEVVEPEGEVGDEPEVVTEVEHLGFLAQAVAIIRTHLALIDDLSVGSLHLLK